MNASRRFRLPDRPLLALLALGLAGWLGWQNGIGRIDHLLYDVFLNASPATPAPELVIVAIDEPSLAEIGRWPWPRSVHADLIERISAYEPRAIGLDLLLSEPDTRRPGDDANLAAAMRRSGVVTLPVFMANPTGRAYTAMLPQPDLAGAAAALGHVSVEIDADGIVRSVFLREGVAGAWWPHFALALLDVAGYRDAGLPLPGRRDPDPAPRVRGDGVWYRDYNLPVGYAGPAGTYEQVSALSVLNGTADGERFRGRIVLIGPTAVGLGDVYPTPVSGLATLMPGVEITANVMGNLLSGDLLRFATPLQNAGWSMLPVLVLIVGLWRLAPRRALALVAVLIAATLLAGWLALREAGYWFAPGAALAVLVALYLLWNWRRLEAAIRYLGDELERLRQNGGSWLPTPAARPGGDLLDRRIGSLRLAAEHLRFLNQFISTTIASLPDITVVTDDRGMVMMGNLAAAKYFGVAQPEHLRGHDLGALLGRLAPVRGGALLTGSGAEAVEAEAFRLAAGAIGPAGCECRGPEGYDFLLKAAPCHDPLGGFAVWVFSLVDITALRQAERKRDEALRFLSHDMRAPQAAVLSLLDMYGDDPTRLPLDDMLRRIREHVGRTQSLADNFIQLARAESIDFNLGYVDYCAIMMDAADVCWEFAEARSVRVELALPDESADGNADAGMLTRACVNLIHNAIKYSPANSVVRCSVGAAGPEEWCMAVSDTGRGIAPEDHARVFQRFSRFGGETRGARQPDGAGLGLAFTRIVVERHGGRIEFDSVPDAGTEFRIYLPALRQAL